MVTLGPPPAEIRFPGKDPGEALQFFHRQHWVRLLWPATKAGLLTITVLAFGILTIHVVGIENPTSRHALILILLALFLVFQYEFLVRFYRHFLSVIIVTDRRIHRIRQSLLAMSDHESIDLWQLQDIHKVQQGVVQNLLGYGSLHLEAQNTMLRLHFMPRVDWCHAQMLRLRERARMQA